MNNIYAALALASKTDPASLLALGDYLEENGEIMLLEVGKKYLVMDLAMYHTGEVIESTPGRIVLKNAAWIPDTGRLSECLATGKINECEPSPDGVLLTINPQHLSRAWDWNHPLPRKAK